MGRGSAREQLENKMMAYKLQRMEVQVEKEKELKKLAEIEGHTIERNIIPDYIDPQFAKEKRLYFIDNEQEKENKSENNEKSSKKTGHSAHNKKSNKKKLEEKNEKKKKKKK